MNTLASNAQTQFASIGGNQIAYRKFGEGSPLIIANRLRGVLDTWDPLFLDVLATQNTVVIFDYPGIGDSEGSLPLDLSEVAAGVIELADYLKYDKFNVAGWSYGGWLTQYVTFLYPERVLKAVVIGGNPVGKNEIPIAPIFLEKAFKPTNEFEDFVILFYEPNSAKSRLAAKASQDRIEKRLEIEKVPATQELFNRYFAAIPGIVEDKLNFREAYSTIKTPLLVVSGDNDISVPVENWFPLLRKAATMQLIIMPEAGHGPQHQYPELTGQYINTFLKNE